MGKPDREEKAAWYVEWRMWGAVFEDSKFLKSLFCLHLHGRQRCFQWSAHTHYPACLSSGHQSKSQACVGHWWWCKDQDKHSKISLRFFLVSLSQTKIVHRTCTAADMLVPCLRYCRSATSCRPAEACWSIQSKQNTGKTRGLTMHDLTGFSGLKQKLKCFQQMLLFICKKKKSSDVKMSQVLSLGQPRTKAAAH